MKPTRLLLAAAGLIVISNALSLAGVAWNRSGTPDSQLRLSERELPFAWREFGPQENSNLALRLALGQLTGAHLPLPVDDLPASLDPRRLQAALRALERFAAEHQLLLASSDEELAKRAARERWPLIDLNQLTRAVPHGPAAEEDGHAGQLHLL